ncbi:hypothetical protein [Methylocystis parvus]|uniref:hypothetical protein n=1 Tax=Methylocystis parvus TaxID=134 RepID=UPI003C7115BF
MTHLEQGLGILQCLRGAALQGDGSVSSANAGDGFAQTIKRIEDDARDSSGRTLDPPPYAPEPLPSSPTGISVALPPCLFPYAVASMAPEQAPHVAIHPEPGSIGRSKESVAVSLEEVAAAIRGAAPTARDELVMRRPHDASKDPSCVAIGGITAANASSLPPVSETGGPELSALDATDSGTATDVRIDTQDKLQPAALTASLSSQEMQGGAPRIHINELAVHLPIALDRAVTEVISQPGDARSGAARQVVSPAPARQEALKILKFDVEPAAMGPISVRMKITQSRIEIRMDAQSAAAPALMEAREALSATIGDRGLTLDAYEVRVLAAPQSTTTPDASAESRGNLERGFANDDGSNQQERRHASKRAMAPRDEPPSSFVPLGLVL